MRQAVGRSSGALSSRYVADEYAASVRIASTSGGEGEDEGRSKATDSYSDLTPHLPPTQRYGGAGNPLPFVKGEAALPRLNNEEAVSI